MEKILEAMNSSLQIWPIKSTKHNITSYTYLPVRSFLTLNDIKNTLLSDFDEKEHDNISLEAR